MPKSVDPAKFVVIDDAYPQHADYPAFCAKTTELLLGLPIRHIDDLVEVVSSEIATKQSSAAHRLKTHHPRYEGEQQLYGQKRRTPTGQTYALYTYLDESQPYHAAYKNFLKRSFGTENYPRPFQKTFWHVTGADSVGTGNETEHMAVPLTTITNKFEVKNGMLAQGSRYAEPLMVHAEFENPKSANVVWREVNELFQKAQKGDDTKEKKRSALKCYWLLSHYCPFIRRSATLARITLAYLEEKGGFSLPPTRRGIDLNIEALMRSESDFVSAAMKEEFFNPSLSSEAVLDWHSRTIEARAREAQTNISGTQDPLPKIAYVRSGKVDKERRNLEKNLPAIEEKLGYSFRNKKLLEAALTHDSACANHLLGEANPCERLKVLGNAVLRMALAKIIYDQPGIFDESMATNAIGRFHEQTAMARIADALELPRHLVASEGMQPGSKAKSNLLESVVGAIWADAVNSDEALENTVRFIRTHFQTEQAFSTSDPSVRDESQVLNILKFKTRMHVNITHTASPVGSQHNPIWLTNLVIKDRDQNILFQLDEPITTSSQKAGKAEAIKQALSHLEQMDQFRDMIQQSRRSQKSRA